MVLVRNKGAAEVLKKLSDAIAQRQSIDYPFGAHYICVNLPPCKQVNQNSNDKTFSHVVTSLFANSEFLNSKLKKI